MAVLSMKMSKTNKPFFFYFVGLYFSKSATQPRLNSLHMKQHCCYVCKQKNPFLNACVANNS